MSEDKKPFTPKSLAARWSCSGSYIYRLMADGKLKFFRVGGKLKRISYNEVIRWEENPDHLPTNHTTSENTDLDDSATASAAHGMKAQTENAIDLESKRKSRLARSFMRSHGRT
jgi:excisionase family DNA binding protein